MEGKGLLSLIVVSNEMDFDGNIKENISFEADNMDTTQENINYSTAITQIGNLPTFLVNNIKPEHNYGTSSAVAPSTMNPLDSRETLNIFSNPSTNLYDNGLTYATHGNNHQYFLGRPVENIPLNPINNVVTADTSVLAIGASWAIDSVYSMDSACSVPSVLSNQYISENYSLPPSNRFSRYTPNHEYQEFINNEAHMPMALDSINSAESTNFLQSASISTYHTDDQNLSPLILFKSCIQSINSQEDIDSALCLPLNYQYMFDKRTSPWEMKNWDQDDLNSFLIKPEKIDRLYHISANDEDPNFRTWELCCRMDYKGEKYFVEMYANCDYTGFDCQGGGHVCITKLADFFLNNMVTNDQNPDKIFNALLEDGYDVQEPDPLHKMHPKFWNNTPMLKYLCHNAIYENKDKLPHYKVNLPQILANSVDEFIQVKDWENE